MADLEALAGGDDAVVIPESIAACLAGNSLDLSSDGMERLERAGAILLDASGRSGRQRVRDLVEPAWVRLGGPACVQNRSELLDANTYFNLVESLDNEGLAVDGDTVAQRLRDLYAEPDADAGDRLQVMTIYSAKGLEFDTVILPGLNKGTRGDDGKLLHWFEIADADRFVMSPMRNVAERERQRHAGDLIKYISSIEQRRQAMENGRLLYVASTRATTSLYLFAAIEPDARGNISAGKQTLLGGLWPAIRDAQTPLITAEACTLAEQDEGSVPAEDSGLPQLHRRLEPEWSLPDAPGPVPHGPVQASETGDYVEFRWAGEDARLTGNLVHRLFQLIAEKGVEFWKDSGGMTAREAWCRKQLQAEGVLGRKADNIVSRTSQAISNGLSSEKGRWILGDHDEASCELALTTTIDSQVTNLILDRTFVEKGVRWIIDYKTSVHSGGDLEGFLENEAERYRSQIVRYRRAMAAGETRPIRTALYFPLLDRFCELPEQTCKFGYS
jgi:ATP-dependent exoDNAse (exonuclease V) beta subunit